MPFKKGNQEAKKKGAHLKTKQWEELGEAIVTQHAERFNRILADCNDELFLKYYSPILEYFKPKLGRTEIKGSLDVGIKEIKIIRE